MSIQVCSQLETHDGVLSKPAKRAIAYIAKKNFINTSSNAIRFLVGLMSVGNLRLLRDQIALFSAPWNLHCRLPRRSMREFVSEVFVVGGRQRRHSRLYRQDEGRRASDCVECGVLPLRDENTNNHGYVHSDTFLLIDMQTSF